MKKILFLAIILSFVFTMPQSMADNGPEHECTSWIIFSDLTKNNTNILHKNRDAVARDIMIHLSPETSPRKWISQGNSTHRFAMAMNASGLAAIMNSGEKCINFCYDPAKKSTTVIVQQIMESCDTAAQAVAELQKIVRNGEYSHGGQSGSTFLFCDTREGYVCEMTAKDISTVRYDKGYTVRANIWLNPNMQQLARSELKKYLNSANRMYMASTLLNKALDENKQITLTDIFALSRHHQMPADAADKRSVCFKYTNSTSSFEIDRQYPDVLSTAHCTIGHPLHTVYVPIPVCVEKVHPTMVNGDWSKAAWARFDKVGLKDIPAEWSKFEKDQTAKYVAAKNAARKLLDQGKRREAVKLINDTAAEIWDKAAGLLKLNINK